MKDPLRLFTFTRRESEQMEPGSIGYLSTILFPSPYAIRDAVPQDEI